jgi:arylsulfatase A-like enzyme
MLANPEVVSRPEANGGVATNVIVYVVDCLRADHVGAYGYTLPTTPNIDALAKESVVLERLTSCAPWTKPSTACLFTSLLPTDHRACTVDDALGHDLLTLAESFRDSGYSTAAFVANQVIDPGVFFFNQGFDRWVDLRSVGEREARSNFNDGSAMLPRSRGSFSPG